MALNKIYAYTQEKTREVSVGANVQAGTPLLVQGQPAVTITASGGANRTQATDLPAGVNSVNYDNGGVGNRDDYATVAFDGTFEFDVTGSTSATVNRSLVYITGGGDLTTSEGGNTLYGRVDTPPDYRVTDGRIPVEIGA